MNPPSVAAFPARTVDDIVSRAARPDFDRWADQVTRCGHCSHPVRLRGRVEHHTATGRRVAYSTDGEPDRVLLIRCGNRRAAVCPSCSWEYAGDMWQLLYAGAAGGRKGVPETIRSHPLVFATLTAPGFGPVHTTRADRSGPARCRPVQGKPRLCAHGRPTWCTALHPEDDPRLGQPICPDCYDYCGHIAFNWHAPELWRRFTITLRRTLARHAGLTAADFARRCRVSFVKVAEFQRRGVVHFHALIRLDGPGDEYQPPQISIDAAGLADAIRQAAAQVRVTVEMPDGPDLVLRFGTQLDTQTVNGGSTGELTGELTAEHAARYIAKYATKSAEDFGLGERRTTPEAVALLDVCDHVGRLVCTAWQLGEHPAYEGLRRWVHMLGFRGHFASKSRRYSTTLGAIRAERRSYRQRQGVEDVRELIDDDATLVVSHWQFAGVGYLTAGDSVLALSAAGRAREQRKAARDAA
ncbi:MAG: replication initiation protein [Pseudonocardiales bacterium]|nr:replication initiation protein [Pseudonocardiales bacterium]